MTNLGCKCDCTNGEKVFVGFVAKPSEGSCLLGDCRSSFSQCTSAQIVSTYNKDDGPTGISLNGWIHIGLIIAIVVIIILMLLIIYCKGRKSARKPPVKPLVQPQITTHQTPQPMVVQASPYPVYNNTAYPHQTAQRNNSAYQNNVVYHHNPAYLNTPPYPNNPHYPSNPPFPSNPGYPSSPAYPTNPTHHQ